MSIAGRVTFRLNYVLTNLSRVMRTPDVCICIKESGRSTARGSAPVFKIH